MLQAARCIAAAGWHTHRAAQVLVCAAALGLVVVRGGFPKHFDLQAVLVV
jgi:hypothetical protein